MLWEVIAFSKTKKFEEVLVVFIKSTFKFVSELLIF